MPQRQIAAHAHVAIIGADSVWLDLREDAYLCLPEAGVRRLDTHTIEFDDPEVAAALSDAGLVVALGAAIDRDRRDLPRLPARDLSHFPGLSSTRSFSTTLLAASSRLYRFGHGASILELLTLAGSRPISGPGRPAPLAATLTLARRANRWLRWLPWSGQCLQHSFMLTCALRHAGLDATWVIGVRTWPFLAHAWVQVDDVALSDTAERLSGFEPILAS